MELKNTITGEKLNTNDMPDVDAILLEETKILQELFVKYNRHCFLLGDVTKKGILMWNIGNSSVDSPSKILRNIEDQLSAIDQYVKFLTNNKYCVSIDENTQL